MSSVSTTITSQDAQFLDFPFQDNQSQYCDTYTNGLIGYYQQSIVNPSQQNIVLIANISKGQENQTMKLENILTQIGIEYNKNDEQISLNKSLFEKWQDKIEELLFQPLPIEESLIQ